MARYIVATPRSDGGLEVFPMKEWLRMHPEHVPSGHDATNSTSRQLLGALRKQGWSVQIGDDEVRLIPQGTNIAQEIVAEVLGAENPNSEESWEEAAFHFEAQLRDFIAQNLGAIDIHGRRLHLFEDTDGRKGIEYPTAVGYIDILAADQAGGLYVLELKRARSPDHAIGQLARYMGWLRREYGPQKNIYGIIIAQEITQNLRYAISVIPNVSLFEYKVEFKLCPAENIQDN